MKSTRASALSVPTVVSALDHTAMASIRAVRALVGRAICVCVCMCVCV